MLMGGGCCYLNRRALDLVYALVNEGNIIGLTKELLDYLAVAEPGVQAGPDRQDRRARAAICARQALAFRLAAAGGRALLTRCPWRLAQVASLCVTPTQAVPPMRGPDIHRR